MNNLTEIYNEDMETICRYCAIISFSIGTLIFLLFLGSNSDGLIMLGLYFTLFAVGINTLLFLFNSICAFFSEKYWKKYLTNSGLLLVNIPIAILYLYIVLEKSVF